MKIGIITVFDAVNYGSFLQAFCLQEVLKELGQYDITMIKTSSLLYEKWRFTSLFTYKPNKIKFKFTLAKGYFKLWKNFKSSYKLKGYDLVFVGSDEMWELNNITMKPLPQFFGVGIESKKLVSYAISSNSTTKDDILRFPFIKEGIKKFDMISVRDVSTYNAYKTYIDKQINYCIDPTLLVDLNKYVEPTKKTNYILVYTYTFKPYMIEKVIKLAKDLNKKIIAVGQNFKWADECLPATAFEFLGLIKGADYVVTDTFHGTVLSIALNKQFVSCAYKTKVYRIIEQFGLEDRNVGENSDLLEVLSKNIDYATRVNDIIICERQKSIEYIKKCLE